METSELIGVQVFGPYEVTRIMDEGGTTTLLEATHDSAPEDRVAVKLLGPGAASDTVACSLASMEAVTAAALEHPHIAGVLGFGELAEDQPYVVMELLVGEGLDAWLKRVRTLSPVVVRRLVEQAGGALQAVHDAGLSHGGLKPRYVFLCKGEDGDVVKLLGFGVCRVTDPPIPGPGSFLPPEVEAGEEPDASADVYALGGVAYHALTGELPGTDPRPVSELAPDAPAALDAVLGQALAPEKADRYATANALVEAFVEAVPAGVEPESAFEDSSTVIVEDAQLDHAQRPVTGAMPTARPAHPTGPLPMVPLPPEPRPSMKTGPERPVHLTGPMPRVTLPPEPLSMKTGPERPAHPTGPMPQVSSPEEPRPARDSALQPRRTAVAPPTGDDLPQLDAEQARPDRASSVFDAIRIKNEEAEPDDETEEATDFISVDQLAEEPEAGPDVTTVREFQEADTTESSFEAAATTETATEDFKGTLIAPEAGGLDGGDTEDYKATVALPETATEDFKATTVIPPVADPEAAADASFDDAPTTMFDPSKLTDDS